MKLSDFINRSPDISNSSGDISSVKDLELILDIIKKINSKLSLNDVLNNVLNYAIKITSSDRGFILLKNSVGDLKYEIGIDISGQKISEDELRISTKVAHDVFTTGHSRFIEGAQRDREYQKSQSIAKLSLQTIFCSPLTVEGNVIGVIYVDSTILKKINISEITRTFEILAGQAAIAIRNAQLFERMSAEKERAKEFNKLKTEFLNQVSHEIRTPLNVIMSFSQLIGDELETVISPEVKYSLRSIRTAGDRIVRTIDLILKMSELKSGTYTFKYTKVDVKDVINEILDKYMQKIFEKKITIRNYVDDPQIVLGDLQSINQMIANVIDNAVKFTSNGDIEIRLYKEYNYVTLEIKDTGVGISEEFMPKVFDYFTQEETGYSRQYDGLGLGLTLVKHLAEINNCKLDLESEKGKGTTVKFSFMEYNHNLIPHSMFVESLLP